MYWLIWLVTFVFILWNYFRNVFSYWQRRGVPTPRYKYFFGNMWEVCTFKKNFGVLMTEIYNQFQGYRYVGFYNFSRKGILLRDTELIRDILVKDFASFHDNCFYISEEDDIIFGNAPFTLRGDRWAVVRARISPSFTMSKVKAMMPLFVENSGKLLRYLEGKVGKLSDDSILLEARELASKITLENVGSCAFGLNGGCFQQEDSEFRQIGRKLTQPSFVNGLKRYFILTTPSLSKLFKVKFFFDDITNYLRNIVRETLKYRKAHGIIRNDFLDTMHDLQSEIGDDKVFGEDDILAHAGGFFLDGYETSAGVISHVLFDLAANIHAQNKLRNEIKNVFKLHNGTLTFDAVQDMKYLDWVIKESLRLHVPLLSLRKLCTKRYKLPPAREDGNGQEVEIEPGTIVVVPVYGLQLDAKHFPEPDKFIPERFKDENKEKINRFAYLPFGEGPRLCLGNKFGILQTKMAIITIIEKYKLNVNPKTTIPWKMDAFAAQNVPVGGLWLNFTAITNK